MPRTTSLPTLAQIAQIAGVSVPTASRVVNGRENVAPETRLRVEEAVRKAGYVRRPQSAPSGPVPLVDVVLPGFGSGWSGEVLRGAEAAGAELGLGIVVSSWLRDRAGRLDRLAAHGTSAVLFAGTRLNPTQHLWLSRRRIPYAVLEPGVEPPPGVPAVGADNRSGGRAATEHLLALGHRRIAVLGGHRRMPSSNARINGYRQALTSAWIKPRPEYVRHAGFDTDRAEQLAGELLDLPEPPTALFLCSDEMAFGVLRAAGRRGLRVPDDLSVVGFDDIPDARRLVPGLTTVHQPIAEMAATALRTLVRLLHGLHVDDTRTDLPTRLVVRGSTAPPPPVP
ncbi:LacI family transcriptional regulator [Streptomyces sp. NBC_00075]|uniref:LacI family DNA-binding transcriptional regulator n=1 Tax=Streptomyces sp. NBC_00075 TaxID=2975641 RepID=UPI00324C1171